MREPVAHPDGLDRARPALVLLTVAAILGALVAALR